MTDRASDLPSKFTLEEKSAYQWLWDCGKRGWMVDLRDKSVHTASGGKYGSLVLFATTFGWGGAAMTTDKKSLGQIAYEGYWSKQLKEGLIREFGCPTQGKGEIQGWKDSAAAVRAAVLAELMDVFERKRLHFTRLGAANPEVLVDHILQELSDEQ